MVRSRFSQMSRPLQFNFSHLESRYGKGSCVRDIFGTFQDLWSHKMGGMNMSGGMGFDVDEGHHK